MLKVVEVVVILLIPTLALAALLAMVRLGKVASRWMRRRPAKLAASAIPLEVLAANLRRLHRQVAHVEDGADMSPGRALRVRAVRAAYGDSLLDACRALDVPGAPEGSASLTTAEIYRLEAALRERGLDVRPTAMH